MGIIIDAYDLLKSVLIFDLNVPNSEKLLFELICGAQMKKYVIKLFALACACAPTAFAPVSYTHLTLPTTPYV